MRLLVQIGLVLLWANASSATEASLRPVARSADSTVENSDFSAWLDGFRLRAAEQGVSAPVLDSALRDVRFDEAIIQRDRNQSEFTKTIWDYLSTAVSASRVSNGTSALKAHDKVLTRIEAAYGVEKEIVTAIWGLESAYGSFRGKTRTIEALATLSFDARRAAFFETQLMAALEILQAGDVEAERMTGSWAGAMGHTQFMPTSFLEYAVDFTDDGRRDIWAEDPSDALASTAAYLNRFGWTPGQPWGVEVRIPENFDYRLADRKTKKTPSEWASLGVVRWNENPIDDHGPASILLPAGANGAAFMIFDNFAVLERYNTADAYVIGVGHLADRLRGAPAIQGKWPTQDRALSFEERTELQTLLTNAGFDTKKIDGKIGPLTIGAVRDWQSANGQIPDGYASLRLLQLLRAR